MIATLERIDDIADHIRTYWLRPEHPVQYVAGQFTELYLPHANADDRGERRWFTLSSSPTEELLAITTRFSRGRSSTFKQRLSELMVGTPVSLAHPMGDFVLPKNKAIPLLFAAVGMGVTPARSMVKYLLDTDEQRDITLIHAVPAERHVVFRDVFEAYSDKFGIDYQPLIREPGADWLGQHGTLTPERVVELLGDRLETQVYLSGPEELVKKLAAEVKAHGVAGYRVVTDLFPGYHQ
jgi:ferredoxin-NADP reductase